MMRTPNGWMMLDIHESRVVRIPNLCQRRAATEMEAMALP